MTPREIIAAAWAITTKEPAIRRWAFTSSFFETLLDVKLLGYQSFFAYKYFTQGTGVGFFDVELILLDRLPLWVAATIIVFFTLLVIVELFIPHLCLGAIIGLAAKSYRKEEVKGGLVLGLYNFFPIFAIHEFLVLSGFTTLLTVTSLILRYVSGDVKYWSIGMAAFFFLIANLLKFFFSFAEEAVVTQKMGIFTAIGRSFKLIVSHLGHVMFLILLLLVISLRIVINMLMVIVLPGIIIGIGFLLALFLSPALSYLIAGIIGILLILAASYFFAYLHAFKQTVWTLTYLELIQLKELDVIVEDEEA